MVPAQKLRKMDNLDIEKTRDDEQAEKAGGAVQERQSQEAEGSTSKDTESHENASVPPLRPLTRSLTGRASKPRARDDSWYEAPKKGPAGRKKGKSPRKRTIDEVDKAESEEPQDPPPAPEPTVPPLSSAQAVFIDASGDRPLVPPSVDNRISRSRTNLPVPVPNLIKKSRGRRVPIVASANGEEEANKRLHVCKVEGCGKCFHRGEHLKRHIRSIHTHEKPFPCTFPSCHKFFNRHDNLLQHVKVHRNGDDDIDAEGSPAPDDSRPTSPTNDDFESAEVAPLPILQRTTSITYPTLGAPMTYGPTTQSSSYATNMAVSSLRTELPDTPSKPGMGESAYGDAQAYAQQQEQEQEQDRDHDHDHDDQDHEGIGDDQPYAQNPEHGDGQPYAQNQHGEDQPYAQNLEQQQQPSEAAPEPAAGAEQQQYGFDPAQGGVDGQGEHPAPPNGHVMQQFPQQPQSYYRLRTPPPPMPMPMHPPPPAMQEWQATF
ncbi:hypothetical protein C8R44DRAFT_16195 [Mycena epipterygia]|nr:hypothetical protein C8R44DRAFT_16195 [Mycena epipterygia]